MGWKDLLNSFKKSRVILPSIISILIVLLFFIVGSGQFKKIRAILSLFIILVFIFMSRKNWPYWIKKTIFTTFLSILIFMVLLFFIVTGFSPLNSALSIGIIFIILVFIFMSRKNWPYWIKGLIITIPVAITIIISSFFIIGRGIGGHYYKAGIIEIIYIIPISIFIKTCSYFFDNGPYLSFCVYLGPLLSIIIIGSIIGWIYGKIKSKSKK